MGTHLERAPKEANSPGPRPASLQQWASEGGAGEGSQVLGRQETAFHSGSGMPLLQTPVPVSWGGAAAHLPGNLGVETQVGGPAFTMGDSILYSPSGHYRAISMKLASFLPQMILGLQPHPGFAQGALSCCGSLSRSGEPRRLSGDLEAGCSSILAEPGPWL